MKTTTTKHTYDAQGRLSEVTVTELEGNHVQAHKDGYAAGIADGHRKALLDVTPKTVMAGFQQQVAKAALTACEQLGSSEPMSITAELCTYPETTRKFE